MPKFRKKPVVIDAQQWWPPSDPRHDPSMVTRRKGNSVSPPDYRKDGDLFPFTEIKGMGADDIFFIRTGGSNSDVQVHPGDWIITGVRGEKYPCKPDVFAATYEPTCPKCNGTGIMDGDHSALPGSIRRHDVPCPECRADA